MTQPTGAQCAPPSVKDLQDSFLEILPRIETHARIWFRYIGCPGRREDHVAEVIALAWKWFLRLRERGKDAGEFASALASLAARAVRSGRRVAGQERASDVMSPLAQARAGFRVERLPASLARDCQSLHSDPHGQEAADAFEERLRDNTRTPVPEQAAFRCDFPRWLAGLGERHRRVADDLAAGERTLDVARKACLSPGRVSQLRRELRESWLIFNGE